MSASPRQRGRGPIGEPLGFDDAMREQGSQGAGAAALRAATRARDLGNLHDAALQRPFARETTIQEVVLRATAA